MRVELYRSGLDALLGEYEARRTGPRLFLTPNLDHLRLLKFSPSFRHAYAAADFVINDSRLLDRLALRGRSLCAPGADWVPRLLERLPEGSSVLVIGYTAGVRRFLDRAFTGVKFDYIEPSFGYFRRRAERRGLVAACRNGTADIILICTGAPQSEIVGAQLRRALVHPAEIICCGSTLQFLAGEKQRAPRLFRRFGGEWLWRFVNEPYTRKRYVLDALFLLCNLGALRRLRRSGIAHFGTYELAAR